MEGPLCVLSLVPKACGLDKPRGSYLWSVEFEQFILRMVSQISRQRSSERIQCRRLVPLMRERFTATTRETIDTLTSPQATSILPLPTMGNNANRGRNSWKGRP
ncbi:hypothetical protein AVEN_195494-1 [Araneus ventricosus]|uniref:Uncharacterized protein n=1 Tax=Araneus ventricosus TaxID=182803 RepID=A0A4Y2K7A2_ARAVE|nr:hypothetical protein AVEN_195494-1 [Araneus ventricosus]